MAYLNGAFLGYSTMQYQLNTIDPVSYNKVTIYGGQSIFDKFHIQNIILTNEQIQAINPTDNILWQPSTLLLADFDSTLDGGNIVYLPSALVGWKIYRKEVGSEISLLIGEMDAGNRTFVDYGVPAYRNFVYEIIPYTVNELGSPIVTNEIFTDFFGWYLMDYINPSIVYKFDLNLTSQEMSNETDVTIYETYTKKPVANIGDRDYLKGNVNCIAGAVNVNNTLYQPIDYLTDLRSFINNKKPKLLKSRKGNVWKVITYGMPEKFMDELNEQVSTISFNFCEVM